MLGLMLLPAAALIYTYLPLDRTGHKDDEEGGVKDVPIRSLLRNPQVVVIALTAMLANSVRLTPLSHPNSSLTFCYLLTHSPSLSRRPSFTLCSLLGDVLPTLSTYLTMTQPLNQRHLARHAMYEGLLPNMYSTCMAISMRCPEVG